MALTKVSQSMIDWTVVKVDEYVTGGSGTAVDPWVGWATGITWSKTTQYDFGDGYYGYATSPNFGLDFLALNGSTGTILKHTGTGHALVVDAGADPTDFVVRVSIKCRLESNVGAAGGVYCRGVSRSSFDIAFNNVPLVQFREIFGVLNTLRLYQTAFVTGQSIVPTTMLATAKRSAGEETSAGTYYLTAENCSSYGVVFEDCVMATVIGMTSEANGGGYYIDSNSNYNTFINIDLETNTTDDLTCLGSFNTFIGTLSTLSATFGGRCNSVIGGIYNSITNNGNDNDFLNVRYAANGGSFTNNGNRITKRNVYNVNSSTSDIDIIKTVESVNSGTGSVSAANATATTLFNANKTGRFDVVAYITSNDAANFTASATVLTDGAGSARIIANNGGSLTLTLSGLNVQVTQTSGATKTVEFRYILIK
jgi:hypothetical protein